MKSSINQIIEETSYFINTKKLNNYINSKREVECVNHSNRQSANKTRIGFVFSWSKIPKDAHSKNIALETKIAKKNNLFLMLIRNFSLICTHSQKKSSFIHIDLVRFYSLNFIFDDGLCSILKVEKNIGIYIIMNKKNLYI
jgi:hypothetical protein